MRMNDLIESAERWGIPNPTLFLLLPPNKRETELKKAIEKQRKYAAKTLIGRRKLSDYLWYFDFANWCQADGAAFHKAKFVSLGACSAFRKGKFLCRSFDWYYSETAEFVVHRKGGNGIHGSVGVAQGNNALTDAFVQAKEWTDDYKSVPFLMTDGINDAGVCCEINVCPAGDKGHTTGTNPHGDDLCAIGLVRYILDHADNAKHAVELVRGLNIWCPASEEVHFLIADINDTFAVEFIHNEVEVFGGDEHPYPGGKEILTNFYLSGWNGEIVTGFENSGIAPEETTLTPHAMGTERYEWIAQQFDSISTKSDAAEVIRSVRYTKTYAPELGEPIWYSEFTGGDRTIYQDKSEYADILARAQELYAKRKRDGVLWHSMHTSVYNLAEKSLTVCAQEQYERTFRFNI